MVEISVMAIVELAAVTDSEAAALQTAPVPFSVHVPEPILMARVAAPFETNLGTVMLWPFASSVPLLRVKGEPEEIKLSCNWYVVAPKAATVIEFVIV